LRPCPGLYREEAWRLRGEIPGGHCKNLFRDEKGSIWLIVLASKEPASISRRFPGSARALELRQAEPAHGGSGVEPAVTPFV
jgi:Ala-tRNA(Pro) deacylase